jgi:hypothetical protein
MNAERPAFVRALAARLSAVLLGALVLYVAGAGPASYYETRFAYTYGRLGSATVLELAGRMYAPLMAGVEGTPLKQPVTDYRDWWIRRAAEKYPIIWTWSWSLEKPV